MLRTARSQLGRVRRRLRRIAGLDPEPPPPRGVAARSLCWGRHAEAERLGAAGQGTRKWAYRWIEAHVRDLAPVGRVADLGGGGVDSVLAGRLARYAREVLVIDRVGDGARRGAVRQLVLDLEQGLAGIDDGSIDVIVTASALEHLSAGGQARAFAEAQRVLAPGGVFCGTISYVARLDDRALALIQADPVFEQIGSSFHCRFDARRCLEAAPRLRPPLAPPRWSDFPGYPGFDEEALGADPGLISDRIGSYGEVRVDPEIDRLELRWFELGLYLVKERDPG
jgi:SAM-dependent methyltransferase